MLEWRTPALSDREWITKAVSQTDYLGSDCSFANIFLLRNKYNIKICRIGDMLVREYNGPYCRNGYTFPLGEGDVLEALSLIKDDSVLRGKPFQFCFLSEEQKEILEKAFPDEFTYSSEEGDVDYIYLTEPLSKLSGRKYHKHKNHVLKFKKTYEDITILPLDSTTKKDALIVANTWFSEHPDDSSLIYEQASITEALEYLEELGLEGIVIYADGHPAAMSIVSRINNDIYDIHYEKAIDKYARDGAYSTVCSSMAGELTQYTYINREEDMGIEGLRKSKLSYRPVILYKKYRAWSA